MERLSDQLGFIGSGNMAEALIRGIIAAGTAAPEQIHITDVRAEHAAALAGELGVKAAAGNADLIRECAIIILAVKPQNMADVARGIWGRVRAENLFISILAGVRTEKLESSFRHPACGAPRVVRVMPNTPALVRAGASALAKGRHSTDEDLRRAKLIFDAVGISEVVDESLMDAITGLTGSGPAYVFRMIEALTDAAAAQGIDRAAGERLVKQMVFGAALMAKDSEHDPAELRRRVTSPNGTTAAGLAVMEERGFAKLIHDVVDAATKRSVELGKA